MASDKLCKLAKSDIKDNLKKIIKIVGQPEYICAKCGRVAESKKNLCNPEKLKKKT